MGVKARRQRKKTKYFKVKRVQMLLVEPAALKNKNNLDGHIIIFASV